MLHIVRLYTSERGFIAYAGDTGSPLDVIYLDEESDRVPPSYHIARERVDRVLDRGLLRWTMCVRRSERGDKDVLVYGLLLGVRDAYGRGGLRFVHGLLLRSTDIIHVVLGILRLLRADRVQKLLSRLDRVASSAEADVLGTARLVVRSLESLSIPAAEPMWFVPSKTYRQIWSVEHDCVGAATIAWLAVALCQLAREPPWEAFDFVDHRGVAQTRIMPKRGKKLQASALLLNSEMRFFGAGDQPTASER